LGGLCWLLSDVQTSLFPSTLLVMDSMKAPKSSQGDSPSCCDEEGTREAVNDLGFADHETKGEVARTKRFVEGSDEVDSKRSFRSNEIKHLSSEDRCTSEDLRAMGNDPKSHDERRLQSVPVAMALSRQAQLALPGAFRVYPFGSGRPEPFANNDSDFLQMDSVVTVADSHVILDATLADGDGSAPIQEATRVDPDQLNRSLVLRRRAIAVIALLALTCLAGIVIGVISSKNGTESAEYQDVTFQQFRDTRLPVDSLHRSEDNPHSPQARALSWLEESLDGSALVSWRMTQRYALAVVYFALQGEGWINNAGWMRDAEECSWWSMRGGCCDGIGRYISLTQTNNNVTGSIPPEIGLLTDLVTVDLSENEVVGQIPTSIGILKQLKEISLDRNFLSGSIPTEIGFLLNLTSLQMERNELRGSIPSQIGMLTKLNKLIVSSNLLTGVIPPQAGFLADLENLSLDANNLNGTIPTSLASLSSLKVVQLDSNLLSGTIPTQVSLFQSVYVLSLASNKITGPIPSELGTMASLGELYLHRTFVSGTIPPEL
jgi:hypothetical protein